MESFLAVPLHFTVEFVGFLVAAGGALLLLSRPTLLPGPPSTRILGAGGLGVFAASQLLHGGALLPQFAPEADPVLLGLRTVAYVLLVMSVLRGARVSAPAVASLSLRQPLALAPALAAAVLGAVCWVAATRTGVRSLRRLSAGALMLGASEVLTALGPARFSGASPDAYAVAAHAVKFAGFALVATWLWSGARSSIRARVVASFAVLLVAVVLVVSSALTAVISRSVVLADSAELTRTLFLVTLGAGVVALALALLFGRRIAQPIRELTVAADAVREGNFQARANVSGSDEVGQLGETFDEMTAALFRVTRDLRQSVHDERDLRARIETIVNSIADGLVAVDGDLRVLAFNPRAEELTKVAAAEARGHPVEDVVEVRAADGEKVRPAFFDLAAGSLSDVFLTRGGAERLPVTITSAVLRDPAGAVTGAVAIIRDMSREREVERMKSQFLANVSHELRTPLTPIKGYAELLGSSEVPANKARRFAQGILSSTQRLERIVELLVDYAALEGGRLAPRATSVDLGVMVGEVAQDLRRRAPSHEVIAEIPARLPKVSGDARLLRRSLEEILDNAVKFSPGGGLIRLEARGHGDNGRDPSSVEIVISDEGIGIAPEHLDKIFTDFHQVDGSETRAYGGLGLGLAFVQRIVQAHEGRIAVESSPERGTKLTITLPAS